MDRLTIDAVNSVHVMLWFRAWFAPTTLAHLHDILQFSDQSSRGVSIRDKQLSLHCWLHKCKLLLPSHASLLVSDTSSISNLVHSPPASIGYGGFFAVGPISTLGLVGDSGRTVRSLSAASKPHIYPTHGAVTPSIQEEGVEHIFRGREFSILA